MVVVNPYRIYSYLNQDNYSFLEDLKRKIKSDGYTNISFSKIIRLAVIELRKNEYNDIKQKLINNEMI